MAEYNTESKASAPLGAVVFALVLSAVVVTLRLYARIYARASLWVDDYFTIVSLFVILGVGTGLAKMTEFGLGRHIEAVSDHDIFSFKRARFVATVLYTVGLFTIKMTFLLQYLRILGDEWRTHRKFLASTLLIGLWAMSEFWVNVFICIPVEGIWDSSVATSCIPNGPYQYVYISLDIVSAIAIFLFPIIFLRHMMIGWPEAFVLSVVFTLGLFVVVLQFVRLQYINLGSDFTWNFADRAALMISELAVAVLCTCIPLLHPLAMRFWPQWFCTIRYLNGNENNLKPPHSEDTEKVHHVQTHHHQITLGTKDASSSGLGFGLPHEVAGSRQKNRNHTPCDALDDVLGSSPRRGDSGDMSDDIMGLQSALRGLKRLSFNRSQSDGDARKLSQHRDSRELARQSPRPDMGRTRTSPYMQSPTLGWERSGSPVDLQPKNPTVAARRAKSPMQMTKGRLTPVVTSRMPSFGGNESEASLVPNYASEQQQQDRPQQQQQRHYLHPDTFYNSISDSNSSYYNKRLPPAPRHMAGGVDVYEEHYRLRRDSDKSARLARNGRL